MKRRDWQVPRTERLQMMPAAAAEEAAVVRTQSRSLEQKGSPAADVVRAAVTKKRQPLQHPKPLMLVRLYKLLQANRATPRHRFKFKCK